MPDCPFRALVQGLDCMHSTKPSHLNPELQDKPTEALAPSLAQLPGD